MKLTFKFNLIFIVIFGLGLAATYVIAKDFLESAARDQVLQQARLMMETSVSTRKYTTEHIRPILDKFQRREAVFYPESVPAFSATKIFSFLRDHYPEYTYKEATLNPTNPEDRAVDWEADIINTFRNDSSKTELSNVRDTPNGRSLFLARPMKSPEPCLECHSTPKVAPAAMVKIYGSNNGFGWKLNETIGAQIVSVPMAIPEALALRALSRLMLLLGGVSLLSLILLNFALLLAVIHPVRRLSLAADEISKGNLDVPELLVRGKDEISMLADSFNRMHRSLVKAIKMLEE